MGTSQGRWGFVELCIRDGKEGWVSFRGIGGIRVCMEAPPSFVMDVGTRFSSGVGIGRELGFGRSGMGGWVVGAFWVG